MEKKQTVKRSKKIKLARILAQAGVASRRASEALILDGHVSVNGVVEKNVARTVDPDNDTVSYNGRELNTEPRVYYKVYKPVGYTSSVKDEHAEHLVTELVPKVPRVYPVGRLDRESEGLLLLTNDGAFTHEMTHPSFETVKVYDVTLSKPITETAISEMKHGITLNEGVARVDSIKRIGDSRLRISIHQGWNRQIRRMCTAVGFEVTRLVRIQEGSIKLGMLQPGEYKKINKPE